MPGMEEQIADYVTQMAIQKRDKETSSKGGLSSKGREEVSNQDQSQFSYYLDESFVSHQSVTEHDFD